jgi:Zn finger protein HypA/HybF involved in hydrogenase expression
MHEAGVAERLLEVVLEQAVLADGERVSDVYLEVGDASGIDAESLTLHWGLLSHGSAADGATLHLDASADPFAFRLASIEVMEGTRPPAAAD